MAKKKKQIEPSEKNPPQKKLIAKKSWHIVQNKYDFKISEGDDLGHIPKHFLEGLKTENVI